MPLVSIDDLSIGFRGPSLLDGVSAKIDAGQRIGLLGRNGAGKTTLMRMLDGKVEPDSGTITLSPGATISRLTQEVPRDLSGKIMSVVSDGQAKSDDPEVQWQIQHAVESTLSRMQLDPELDFGTLSSGMKRRVLLARAIASDPDVLLLDEPTNHLDIPAILWLEKFLSRWKNTLIFVTHDRSFLQNLATRIWEIDRGRLFDWSCDYATFLQRKEASLAAEEKQNALFDKRLAEEEAWIRQGIKARRTRNEGRVRALKAMRTERTERRQGEGKAKLRLQEADRTGALVADVKGISFRYDGQTIIRDFTTMLMRGDKVGIIGPNGAGKTTLLKLLLGQLDPQEGNVRLGTNLQIAYFDQLRDTLDPNQTVQENVGDGSDKIQVGDKTKHIMGYLQDFLFTPERARTEVRFLSGGERNRALLAKLMTKPSNVIVLDEPTNDLDSETLELLEEQLADFRGTLLMVSHDRTFLNNVVTSTIVFEEDGVNEYVGGYDEWHAAVARREEASVEKQDRAKVKPKQERAKAPETQTRKLSYNEKRELEQLPARIESLETDIASLHEQMGGSGYYQQPADDIARDATKLKELEENLTNAFSRWEELDS
ncbi:MAG: ATP-binding cassette domain-containing protein [Rubripirellula sp.]